MEKLEKIVLKQPQPPAKDNKVEYMLNTEDKGSYKGLVLKQTETYTCGGTGKLYWM